MVCTRMDTHVVKTVSVNLVVYGKLQLVKLDALHNSTNQSTAVEQEEEAIHEKCFIEWRHFLVFTKVSFLNVNRY